MSGRYTFKVLVKKNKSLSDVDIRCEDENERDLLKTFMKAPALTRLCIGRLRLALRKCYPFYVKNPYHKELCEQYQHRGVRIAIQGIPYCDGKGK